MSLRESLASRRQEIQGKNATESDLAVLQEQMPYLVPNWLIECLRYDHVIGVRFQLDSSDAGEVVLRWLTPMMIVDEATRAFPGSAVVANGYIPIGSCLRGSGDPYFLGLDGSDDPPLVRICHDCITPDGRPFGKWREVVTDHISDFIAKAKISIPQSPRTTI